MNSALSRTADVLDRERSFTRFASHELRTPAAVIQAGLERIEAHASADQARPIERAHRGLRDMHALIDTFLQLSSDSAKQAVPSLVVVDSAWVTSLFHHVAGGHADHALTIDQRAPLMLAAPETMVHVLVANLLKNALFHGGPEAIEVVISAEAVAVRNAIPEERPAPGFGLGCQIAHRICERFGWRFSLVMRDGWAVARVTSAAGDQGALIEASSWRI
ncbi:MAG: HAMP domain-containing histidine kinase [Sphingomonadales bacterium]|nr:MAG: HAMP domain-containing histidine kinase [Sphingomonadales bacterium]